GAAQGKVEVVIEKGLSPLDISRPAPQELDVLPVMSVLQRLQVVALQVIARKAAARGADALRRLGDEQAHARGRSGEIGGWEVHANGAGGAADGEAVVDQVGDVFDAAAAN